MVYESFSIACRYVPYDQWLITHIDPTWKIKHLKQRIISKCLNIPFDPRFIQKVATTRPPSPITFAPNTSVRGDSPIKFATPGDDQASTIVGDEGYEEDDEWEQDVDHGGKINPANLKLKSKSPPSKFHARLQQKQTQEQETQIPTNSYTLFRFSTGQILEEDFQVSWYDIQPHELVELHSAFLSPTLASSLGPPVSQPIPQTTSTQKKMKSASPAPTDQVLPHIPSVTVLPRHIPSLYIQPYWQGWVRVLRFLWRKQTVPPSDERRRPSFEAQDPYSAIGREGEERQVGRAEWRERWVVIHDGFVNIAKGPMDPNPTRIPLSSLLALRGPEHLAQSSYTATTSKRSTRSKPRASETSATIIVNLRPRSHTRPLEDLPKQTVEKNDKDPKRNNKKTRKDGQQHLFATSSPSLRSPSQDFQGRRMSNYSSASAVSVYTPPPAEGREREREEKALEKKKETEAVKKRDDVGFPFYLSGKDSKDKEKDRDKAREKEEKARELRRILYGTSEQQYKEEKERRRANEKARSKKERDNKTFVPTSREEAEQAGMKVVCAKFVWPPAGRDQVGRDISQDSGFPKTRRYTSTGPSLASMSASAPGGANMKKTSTGPHVIIDMDVHIGKSSFENLGDVHGRHQPQPQPQGILIGSCRTNPSCYATGSAGSSIIAAFGTDLVNTGIKEQENNDEDGQKATERRDNLGISTGVVEDFEASAVNDLDSKPLPPPKDTPTELGDNVSMAESSDMMTLSSPMATRPIVIIPKVLLATDTAVTVAISPESQPPDTHVQDNANSDSSSSISISSPVFAHSAHGSDLDDETLLGHGTATGATSTHRLRKGYRFGGYHFQPQTKKAKSDGEEEWLLSSDVGKGMEGAGADVESKFGDGGPPRQSRREENEPEGRKKDEGYEGWIAFDLMNDNAFNSILRIFHRHATLPLSSSFTPYPSISSPQPAISSKLCHESKARVIPSDTDDDSVYAAKNTAGNRAIHPPILESLVARTAHPIQQPLYVALPYPEWRLEIVNRARRVGMREIGRPLDLALHGWGREFEEIAAAACERKLERELEMEKNRRESVESHVSTIKERGRQVNRVVGGSDADDDDEGDEDEEETVGTTQLDDESESEEESDTEWFAWMTDLPRQFLVQQSQPGVQLSPTSSSIFTNPFSSSPLIDGPPGVGPVPPPRTQEEERFLHANKIRKLEPSATSVVDAPTDLPSPTSTSFADSAKPLPTLSSSSSFESLNQQRISSLYNSTPFPGVSSQDDTSVHKSHTRSQSRSLQHLGAYRYVGSVPEEGSRVPYNATASSSSRQGLYHSASVDQHLASRKKTEIDGNRQNKYSLGKPILTTEQILQIESEVVSSAPNSSLPTHWTFPPMPLPSPPPPPRPPSTLLHTPSHTPSASTSAPVSTNTGEVKASPSISRLTSSDLARWSSALGNSLSTPSSPSVIGSPNSASPPRSVFGSLGRSPSKIGTGQEKEKKGFSLKKRMSRDLGKEKDRDNGEHASSPGGASPNQRPKLFLSSASSSTPSTTSSSSTSYRYHSSLFHDGPSPTPNNPGQQQFYHSPSAISSARALLRRVRSGSSLKGEESNTSNFNASASTTGLGVVSAETEVKEVQKKKKGPIDRIVRGLDSSLAFAEGR